MNTLEQIQEKTGGKLWEKDGKKRLYLDRGHNTKKMSTTTYIELTTNGYVVKCFVDCPSQNYNWIKSQQQEVIESVEKHIENAIAQNNAVLLDYKINEEQSTCDVLVKKTKDSDPIWMSGDAFDDCFGISPEELFGGELESKMDAIYEKARQARQLKIQEKQQAETKEIKKQLEEVVIPKDAKRVSHGKFGEGSVIEIDEENGSICIRFDNDEIGLKKLLIRFANIQFIS